MAYLAQQQDEQNQNQQGQQQNPSFTSEKVLGGDQGGQVGGSNNTTAPQAGAPNKPTKSGSFTNLQSYVNANAGNDAAMGQTIKQNTDRVISDQDTKKSGFASSANSAIDSGTVKQDTGLQQSLMTNPTKVDSGLFNSQYNAEYKGPTAATAVDGYSDVDQGYTKLSNTANQLGEFEGRKEILNNTYGRPNYTQGEQRLDSFILGAGQQGQQALDTIKNNINTAGTGWQDTLKTIGANIQSGIDTTAATKNATRTVYDNAVGLNENALNALVNQASAMTNSNKSQVSQLQAALSSPYSNPAAYNQALSQIGLMPDQAAKLVSQGVNLASLVQANAPVKLGDIATPTQVNNYKALLSLIGATPSKFDFTTSNPNKNAFTVDQAGIDKGIQAYLDAEAAKKQAQTDAAIADMLAARESSPNGSASTGMYKNAPGLQNLTPEQVAIAQAMATQK